MNDTSNRALSTVSNIKIEDDTTSFDWTVGRFKTVRFGDSVATNISVIAGGQKWRLQLFPKGITDPDWASLYVTNVDCELDEGDPVDKNRITSTTLASVTVVMVPDPPNAKKKKDGDNKKDAAKSATANDGDNTKDRNSDTASKSGANDKDADVLSQKSGSTRASSRKSATKTASQAGSKAASGSGKSATSSGSNSSSAAATAQKGLEPIIKKLSQQFTNKESSWGWEQFLDLDKLYSTRSGYLNAGEVRDSSNIQDGSMRLHVTILAITGIDHDPPVNDPKITPSGRQRTSWTIRDFERLTKKVTMGQKLSSAPFASDGEWFFDLYPQGYKEAGRLALFLHSTRSQVERGDIKKQSFQLGIKKSTPLKDDSPANVRRAYELMKCPDADIYFPAGCTCTARFDSTHKCWGRSRLVRLEEVEKGRGEEGGYDGAWFEAQGLPKAFAEQLKRELVAGAYSKGGAVTFVMDMAVTDEETFQVQHMLIMLDGFGNDQVHRCAETGKVFKTSGATASWCRWCGRAFCADQLRIGEDSRMPLFGYEVGREYLMDRIMREQEHAIFQVMAVANVANKVPRALDAIQRKILEAVTKTDEQAAGKGKGDAGGGGGGKGGGGGGGGDAAAAAELRRQKKGEHEQKLQTQFHRALQALREELEHVTFARPVCSKCFEACKEMYSLRTGPSAHATCLRPTLWTSDTAQPKAFRADPPPPPAAAAAADSKGNNKGAPDESTKAATAPKARGGFWSKLAGSKPADAPTSQAENTGTAAKGAAGQGGQADIKPVGSTPRGLGGPINTSGNTAGGGAKGVHGGPGAKMPPWKAFKEAVDAEFKGVKDLFSKISVDRTDEEAMQKLVPPGAPKDWKFSRNATALVRGNIYGDPPELTRQCHGRVHPLNPLDDDDDLLANRTAFCDVRFDRLETYTSSQRPPAQQHCSMTGRVYCDKCVRWNAVIPEFERRPGEGKPVKVSYEGKLEREAARQLQPVSLKQKDAGAGGQKKTNKATEVVEEEEEESEPCFVGFVRKVPFYGEEWADKMNPE